MSEIVIFHLFYVFVTFAQTFQNVYGTHLKIKNKHITENNE